tara:strand:+ start:7708 stop:9231 length:1524 start_codon:yes stop_codon:yes gene_type:complete
LIKLGIDLDNTIICYDDLLYKLAKKKFSKIKINKNKNTKKKIKTEIINNYNNREWTKLQGLIYGKELVKASLFKDFYKTVNYLKDHYEIFVVSHKTKYPAIGKKIDLRKASKKFLCKNKISYCKDELIKNKNIFFANSKKEKINIIRKKKLDIFIDDLNEILRCLPKDVKKIHFSKKKINYLNFHKWQQIKNYLISKKSYILEKKIEKIFNQKIKIIKKINFGSNNEVYKIKLERKSYILKIYKNNKENMSFSKELFFLKQTKAINQTPQIKLYSEKYSLIVMEFIQGLKIKKISLKDITQIINFIKSIQDHKKNYDSLTNSKIRYATDKLIKINDIFENIERRIKLTDLRIKKSLLINYKLNETNHLIKKIYRKIKQENLNKRIKLNKKDNLILSPSDFNVNNIIKGKNKYSFIDFEYSGLDNCYKLILDFISQPDIEIDNFKTNYFINTFNKKLKKQKVVINSNLQILNNIKWFYIILNSKYKYNFLMVQINKALKYFKKRIESQ